MSEGIHKATPLDGEHHGDQPCKVCGYTIKRVPGGSGPTWVHAETGAVVGTGAPRASEMEGEELRHRLAEEPAGPPPTPLPPSKHEGDVRESDDGHVFTGWCSCGWEGDDHDAGTNRRSDEKHDDAYNEAMADLNRHHDVAIHEWLVYLQTPE